MQRISELNPAQVFYTDFAACNAYANGAQAAAALDCPALFLLGRQDVMTPAKAASTLASSMKRARTVTLDACGHSLMAEQPDQVLDQLFAFSLSALK
jgi:pimeloyl-ACP methyl ester carboxylesterase